MRWVAKAALQRGLSALPASATVNYVFQRHVTHSLPISEAAFRGKFARAVGHRAAYAAHGSGRTFEEVALYEFGAGWDLTIPISYWALGVDSQVLVDIQPNLRPELVDVTISRLRALRHELEEVAGITLREPPVGAIASAEDLEARFGIRYLAPCDARATPLHARSIDLVSSTNTLEHIPAADIVPILAECRRLLAPGGVLSSRIDLRDHFCDTDPSLSPYNFLRYSDRKWRLVNSSLQYQNRLRRPDYVRAFAEANLEIVAEDAGVGTESQVDALGSLELAPRFRDVALEDLAVQALSVVAVSASPDRAKEGLDVRRGDRARVEPSAGAGGGGLGDGR